MCSGFYLVYSFWLNNLNFDNMLSLFLQLNVSRVDISDCDRNSSFVVNSARSGSGIVTDGSILCADQDNPLEKFCPH